MEGTLAQAAAVVHGKLHGSDTTFRGVSTDTRTLQPGQLFFALRGPNYDGEEFIGRAAAGRAAGAVACDAVNGQLPVIRVGDTRRALGELACDWRRRMPAFLIGLTGSNGKTTLKEMIASCLSLVAPTLATRGNLNNDIGVPLMLSEIEPRHRFVVIEMGANHAGEIAYLTSLAMPRISVITNAAPAHLEGFGSIEDVARAKAEILQGSPGPEWAVLNADDRFYTFWKKQARCRVASFGFSSQADFRATQVRTSASGSVFRLVGGKLDGAANGVEITLPLAGRHNVLNACAAAAVATLAGVDIDTIRQGLEAATPVSGRLRPLEGIAGARLYDDSYNANPASVIAAAEFLAGCEGEGWLVLADMRELGSGASELHRMVGKAAKEAGVARLYGTGPLSRLSVEGFGGTGGWFETSDELVHELVGELERSRSPVNVLVKGSRSMHMEHVVHALQPVADRRRGT